MSIFLGIGLGPIQTGIFLSGAHKGGFSRLIVAEVDRKLCESLRSARGRITINIAEKDRIRKEEIPGIEIYNPLDRNDLSSLINAAAEADEIATALPGVKFYQYISPWLREAFSRTPEKTRIIYTSENDNYAAEILHDSIKCELRDTHYLNTVIGKMSGVVPLSEFGGRGLVPLTADYGKAHLVEEFNKILISTCPGIEKRRVFGLIPKRDLIPFEEAKLYGHNAIHMLLGLHARKKGLKFMHELTGHPDIIEMGHSAFLNESGNALCRKWTGTDELFSSGGFRNYAEDLLKRMMNPFLRDQVERVCRDLERKLGWNDRIIGTIRLVIAQGFIPEKMAQAARIASEELFGKDSCEIRNGLEKIFGDVPPEEKEKVLSLVLT